MGSNSVGDIASAIRRVCKMMSSAKYEIGEGEMATNCEGTVKYKVGDVVRLVDDVTGATQGFMNGDICKIVKTGLDGRHSYAIRHLDATKGNFRGFVDDKHIEPRYKVGDKVRLVKHSVATRGFSIGDVYEITGHGFSSQYEIKVGVMSGFVNDEHIEPYKDEKEMFKVGDKVRVVNGTDIEGVITLKVNNHGLCSSAIYPLPTVNIDSGNGEIWKVNLDDIELVDEGKEKELELWQSAKNRYRMIHEVLDDLIIGLKSEGSERLGIPGCDFCNRYRLGCTSSCLWLQVINNNKVCSDKNSPWRKVFDNTYEAKSTIEEALGKIDRQIAKLENPDEV